MLDQIKVPLLINTQPSHKFAINVLKLMKHLRITRGLIKLFCSIKTPTLERTLFGIKFKNPVGIAAGLDRKGEFYNELANFGSSFVEIGPVRNVKKTIANLQQDPPRDVVLAVNLNGRLSSNPVENLKEIERAFSLIYDFADILVVTVPGQGFEAILDSLLTRRRYNDVSKPLIVKITNIIMPEEVPAVVEYSLRNGVDCIECMEAYLPMVSEQVQGLIPLIALAEISCEDDVRRLLDSGAVLVAVASGLLKGGPRAVYKILKNLLK